MSDTPKPKPSGQKPQLANDNDEALIINPINIARARHASSHSKSVIKQARDVATQKLQTPPQAGSAAASASGNSMGSALFDGNGCFLFILLSIAFLVGGVIGGLIGGGLLLGIVNTEGVALWRSTPTPTPFLTPTPAPVETLTPTPTPQPSPTPAMEDIIAEIIPSVVTVINQQHNGFSVTPEEGRIVGTGVIIDARGYIATNHHVVEHNSGDLRVVLADGRDVTAELVVSDPAEDLAVVKINAENLPVIKWGDSATVRPGQVVYAIGSPLGDFPNSVSFGIVSGLNRALEMEEQVIDGLIQTDAAINRGSSGGPLINTRGEMIGINTFIIRESEDRGVAEGIAFALPTARAKELLFPWIAAHSGESVPIPAAGEPGN